MKENSISRKLLSLGLQNFYSSATFEITHRCNACCNYCYISEKNIPDLSTEKTFGILDKLTEAGIATLVITGGEPFIRDDILEILEYAIKKDFWHISILSNGTLLTEKHIEFLINHKSYISSLQFSLFSHHADLHDKYLGVDEGQRKMLETASKLKDAGVYIHFGFNLLDFNLKEFKETYTFFKKQGYTIRSGLHKIITQDICQSVETKRFTTHSFYQTICNNAPETFLEHEKNHFQNIRNKTVPNNELLICKGIYKNICVGVNGDIYPCNAFRNLKITNLLQQGSFYDLIQDSTVLQELKDLRRSDLCPCNTCEHSKVCNICLGQIHTESGQFKNVSNQICNYARAITQSI